MDHKIIKFKNLKPKIHESVYIAEGAVIAADVTIAENANIWFNTVIRGDVSPIKIGKNTNQIFPKKRYNISAKIEATAIPNITRSDLM